MVVDDWTIPVSATVGFTASLPNDAPSGGTNPCLQVTKHVDLNSANAIRLIYPTSNTINGTDIRAINDDGKIQFYVKFTETRSVIARRFGVAFRIADPVTATFSAYTAIIQYGGGSAVDKTLMQRWDNGTTPSIDIDLNGDGITDFIQWGQIYRSMSTALTVDTWYKFRVRWHFDNTTTPILLRITFEMYDDGSTSWVMVGTYTDYAITNSGAGTIVGLVTYMAGYNTVTVRTDQFKVYNDSDP